MSSQAIGVYVLFRKPFLRFLHHGTLLSLIIGCTILTPHENFKHNITTKIGLSIDQIGGGWTRSEDLVSMINLPNGQVAYTYKYVRSCLYTFEVNPVTRIITAARWEGSEKDCVIAP